MHVFNTFGALSVPLLLILALHGGAPGVHGEVHTIDVTHHHLPSATARRLVPDGTPRPNYEALRRHHQSVIDYYVHGNDTLSQLDTRDIATTQPVDVGNSKYEHTIIGNVSLGYPAQTFRVAFDSYGSQLYVIDVEAQYYYSYSYSYYDYSSSNIEGNVTDKQTYDPSASSSCVLDVNGTFISNWAFSNGSVASDELRVGDSLLTRVSFMGASLVNDWMEGGSYDGVFGLSLTPDSPTNSTTLLSQLQSSLDSPIVTYNLAYGNSSQPGSGQITLGGLAPGTCQADWVKVGNSSGSVGPSYATFDIAGVSEAPAGQQNGCTYRADIPTRVWVSPDYDYIYTSAQMLELFVQASNATFNRKSWQYELSEEKSALAQPVYLNLAEGGSIRMDPDDYMAVSANTGVTYLNVYGSYDAHTADNNYLTLGAAFLNNHCMSVNIQTGVWSIASAVKDIEIDGSPLITSEGSASLSDSSSNPANDPEC